MAPHSSTLAWKIPWMEEPGRLQSMGSLRVGHDWVTSLSIFIFMHWRRKWQPTPVFLPGESHGWGSLVGLHRVGHNWSDLAAAAAQSNIGVHNDSKLSARKCIHCVICREMHRKAQSYEIYWGGRVSICSYINIYIFGCATWHTGSVSRDWTCALKW